jgi:hypothetical protein
MSSHLRLSRERERPPRTARRVRAPGAIRFRLPDTPPEPQTPSTEPAGSRSPRHSPGSSLPPRRPALHAKTTELDAPSSTPDPPSAGLERPSSELERRSSDLETPSAELERRSSDLDTSSSEPERPSSGRNAPSVVLEVRGSALVSSRSELDPPPAKFDLPGNERRRRPGKPDPQGSELADRREAGTVSRTDAAIAHYARTSRCVTWYAFTYGMLRGRADAFASRTVPPTIDTAREISLTRKGEDEHDAVQRPDFGGYL